jgi:hypothetical protein|tara:strand:- start:3006 stop:3227 length:222 start_codon:yes stop_codon:yes gene_type:complete
MNELVVDLQVSQEKYLLLYKTYARSVRAVSRDGRSIRFPARVLQPFVDHEGVRGAFLIRFDDNNKFRQIQRIG